MPSPVVVGNGWVWIGLSGLQLQLPSVRDSSIFRKVVARHGVVVGWAGDDVDGDELLGLDARFETFRGQVGASQPGDFGRRRDFDFSG